MDVTREDFEAYEDVRISGVTNMFDVRAVESYSGLPREVILDIMEHYNQYRKWLYERKYANMGKDTNEKPRRKAGASVSGSYEPMV